MNNSTYFKKNYLKILYDKIILFELYQIYVLNFKVFTKFKILILE